MNYTHTVRACFVGYIVQAMINNFVPLLFVTLRSEYQLSLSRITALVTINFAVQLLVDLLSAKYVDRLGYRSCITAAHFFISGVLCVLSYLITSLSGVPAVSLLGCALCGFSVGILWPGVFSLAAASLKRGGTAMFALLALAGDVGCSAGPTLVGIVTDAFDGDLTLGLSAAVVFPLVLLFALSLYTRRIKEKSEIL